MICMWFPRTQGVGKPRSVHITALVTHTGFCQASETRLKLLCSADKMALPSERGTDDRRCLSNLLLRRNCCTAHWIAQAAS